jgi:hypothetical protein
MIPRASFLPANSCFNRSVTTVAVILFLGGLSAAMAQQALQPQGPTVLQRGQNSTDFGNSQTNRGKTGPIDWERDEKTGKIRVMLEKNGHYTDGMFLGRGPDGTDYFTFAEKYYRLSVPQKRTSQRHSNAGVLGGLGRVAGPWGGVAGSAAGGAMNHRPAQADFEFAEIPAKEVPPAGFLSVGKAPNMPSQGVPVLTEFKDAKGAITRTLELPNQGQAFVVSNAPCFGADAYVNPSSPSIVYVLSRDAQSHAVTGYKQINNAAGDCGTQAVAAAATPASAPADPQKPSYSIKQIDGDQFRLVYMDNGKKQDIMVVRLKDKLYCSNNATPPRTYIVEQDHSLTVLNSDQAMTIKCQMQAVKQYEQSQR